MFHFTLVKYFIVELEEVNWMVLSYPGQTQPCMSKHSCNFLFLPAKNWSNIRKWLPNEDLKGSFKDKFVSFTTGYRGDFWEGYFLNSTRWFASWLRWQVRAGKHNVVLSLFSPPQTKITLEKNKTETCLWKKMSNYRCGIYH